MIQLGKRLTVAALLVGVALWGLVSPVQAALNPGFQINFFVDGVLTVSIVDNNPLATFGGGLGDGDTTDQGIIAVSRTVGPFSLFLNVGTENAVGSALHTAGEAAAFVTISDTTITNTSASTHTLGIEISSQDFDSPLSPPFLNVFSSGAGNLLSGTMSAPSDFQSFGDTGNALFGMTFVTPLHVYAPPTFSGPSHSFGGPTLDTVTPGFSPTGLYSLTNMTDLTLSGGGVITGVTGSTVAMHSVPEPGSLALVLVGLPFLSAAWLRRRGKQA